MPYLTPEDIPEDDYCRPLSIPASSEWLAIVSGALTELTKAWNWEQQGAVTVPEAVAVMQNMIDVYYGGCSVCMQPNGYRILRINPDTGKVQEIGDGSTWQDATGDYYVPPPPAREGGTSADQICLAAANAENVMHEIYDNLAASFASELSEAEALTALVEFLLVTLGAEFAPITYALALFLLAVFALVYSALAYLSADLWDSNFTEAFKCILVGCASNDAGVVTFDYVCVEKALYAAATTFGIDETQLRLYAQINYILSFIGGADALNTAGANTGITSADCTDCPSGWCKTWDFTVTDGAADGWFAEDGFGSYSAGVGYISQTTAPTSHPLSLRNNTAIPNLTSWDMTFIKTAGSGGNNRNQMQGYNADVTAQIFNNTDDANDALPQSKAVEGSYDNVGALIASLNSGDEDTVIIVTQMSCRGESDNPFGDNNCTP